LHVFRAGPVNLEHATCNLQPVTLVRILIAPNAFKGSLSASAAADAICRGLRRADSACDCTRLPVGDGGDGTGALLMEKLGGRRVTRTVLDPIGRPVSATFGLVHADQSAIIELAEASGLRRLRRDELDPVRATTFGTGELMRTALDLGVRHVILAVGGSATVDGGTGILRALGLRFSDAMGRELQNLPESLVNLASIDRYGMHPALRHCEVTILCDVDNPLLGECGAARVFGPQKGASAQDVAILESALSQFAIVVRRQMGMDIASIPGGGAAGGVSAGLHALIDARLVKGTDYFLDVMRFDDALADCDLVVTGEGRLDRQTLQGKAPMGVATRAKRRGIRVVALAGSAAEEAIAELGRFFDNVVTITPVGVDLDTAIREADRILEQAAFELGKQLAQHPQT